MTGIACPHCGNPDASAVVDSRPAEGAIRRRRKCGACRQRFTTHERADPVQRRQEPMTLDRVATDLLTLWRRVQRAAQAQHNDEEAHG